MARSMATYDHSLDCLLGRELRTMLHDKGGVWYWSFSKSLPGRPHCTEVGLGWSLKAFSDARSAGRLRIRSGAAIWNEEANSRMAAALFLI